MTPAAVDGPRCRSCHRPIWWGRTRAGKLMPIDPHTAESGNVVVDTDEQLLEALAGARLEGELPANREEHPASVRVLRKAEDPGPDVPRYVSHFATCPQAARHRR